MCQVKQNTNINNVRNKNTLFNVFTAANLRDGLDEAQNICKTETAGANSLGVVALKLTIA